MRRRAAFLALAVSHVSGMAAASPPPTPARAATMVSPDVQIAAGNERLRAAAGRLKSAARAAETQPGSAAAKNDLKAALGEVEASYEYLIGMFSKLKATDQQKQLELLRRQLAELKKEKQALVSKMAGGGTSPTEWGRRTQSLVALSDRALAAAVVPPARGFGPTPVH